MAVGVGVFQLGYVVSGKRGTSSSLEIESAQAYIDVFDVALVDTLAWLPGAGLWATSRENDCAAKLRLTQVHSRSALTVSGMRSSHLGDRLPS